MMSENEIVTKALDICFELHKSYGPGLFENVYEELFCFEWRERGLFYKRQYGIGLVHKTIKLDIAYRADLILCDKVIFEFKSIEDLTDVHFKQLLTYLKLANLKLGILVNFNKVLLKDGIKRVVNNL